MLGHLFVQHFRNLTYCEWNVPDGIIMVVGRNGQGKTNLLEAIHVVTQGWSFRSRAPEDWIQWERDACVVRALIKNASDENILAFRARRRDGVETRVNDQAARSLSSLYGYQACVYMGPEDIALVRGSPEFRRRWVDILLCRRFADGVDVLKRYKRVLQQRNRWLKDHRDGKTDDVFEILTTQYIELWSRISSYRAAVIREISNQIAETYRILSDDAEMISIRYASCIPGKNEEADEREWRQAIEAFCGRVRLAEIHQGISAWGAHRDDLELIFSHGYDLRGSGSQGQCRSAALAMGFAALDYARQWSRGDAILLLDDVFAELDSRRRQAVASLIREREGQVLVALPRAEDLPFAVDAAITVENGDLT